MAGNMLWMAVQNHALRKDKAKLVHAELPGIHNRVNKKLIVSAVSTANMEDRLIGLIF
jgi:hypothetical protein